VLRIISLQYNPDSLTCTMQMKTAGDESSNRSETMRFEGPAVETFKPDAGNRRGGSSEISRAAHQLHT